MTYSTITMAPQRLALECFLAAAGGFLMALAVMDVSWWGPDDGAYAYVAERLLLGDAMHKDVQDIHAGYINFVNAAAFKLFGENIVSLRWPLVILAGLETALIYWFVRRHASLLQAVLAGLSIAVLAFPLHANISANWYAFGLALLLAVSLAEKWPSPRYNLVWVGFLVSAIFLFRQTTGVFVGFGALVVLMMQASEEQKSLRVYAGSILLAGAYFLFFAYLLKAAQPVGLLVFGLPPLAILGIATWRANVGLAVVMRILVMLSLGGAIAAFPLVLYHLAHGSLSYWIDDSVLAPLRMTEFSFFDKRSYMHFLMLSFGKIDEVGLPALINGIFWILLFATPAYLTFLLWRSKYEFWRRPAAPFTIVAVFYGVVSLHYEIFIYLFYSAGFLLAALAIMAEGRQKLAAVLIASVAIAVGALYHAGRPAITPFPEGAVGAPAPLVKLDVERASLRTSPQDAAFYRNTLRLINSCSAPDQTIFAFPTNAELYFLSGRRNPFRFFSTAFGLSDLRSVEEAEKVLSSAHGPELVIFAPDDKYNTDQSVMLGNFIEASMRKIAVYEGREIFKRSPASAACMSIIRDLTERQGE